MKKHLFTASTLAALFFASNLNAQVGISKTNEFTPDPSSILDVSSSDKGILIPRVALTSTDVLAPVTTTGTSVPTSLLVYNTARAGTAPNNVVPGFYYWDATAPGKWKPLDTNTDLDTNLYNINGTLSGDRVVSQNGKKLTFRDANRSSTGETMVIGEDGSVTSDQNPSMVFHSGQRRIAINKRNPRVTLDIHAPLVATATAPEGLLIPKMIRSDLAKKDAVYFGRNAGNASFRDGQTSYEGTLVYIFPDSDGVVTTTTTGKTRLINKEGFYYYGIDDLWHPVGGSTSPEPWLVQGGTTQATSNTENIYQNGNVAIGTDEIQAAKLHVDGTVYFYEEDDNKTYKANYNIQNNTIENVISNGTTDIAASRLTTDISSEIPNVKLIAGSNSIQKSGKYLISTDNSLKDSGAGTHTFTSLDGNDKNSVIIMDETGLKIGKYRGVEDATEDFGIIIDNQDLVFSHAAANVTGINQGSEVLIDSYSLPLQLPTPNQVLTYDTETGGVLDPKLVKTKWANIADLAAPIWNKQATTDNPSLITDNIYHTGNLAIGTTSTDAARTEKLFVKGNTRVIGNTYLNGNTSVIQGEFTSRKLDESNPNNVTYYQADFYPSLTEIINTSYNASDVGGGYGNFKTTTSLRMDSEDINPLPTQKSIGGPSIVLETGSSLANSNDYGIYNMVSSPERDLGFGIHNFISSNTDNGNISFFNIDETGIKIGKVIDDPILELPNGNPSSPFETILVRSDNQSRSFYTLPLESPTAGQVLAFDSEITSTISQLGDNVNVSKTVTKWANISDLVSTTQPWLIQGGTNGATATGQDIYHDGKVAIGSGTTAPTLAATTVALHVTGDIEATGRLYSTNSVFADYVFQKYYTGSSTLNNDYDFKSLNYVKEFTAKNHHLPGVTPVSAIAKTDNGYKIDLSEMSMQQLEKIEELFLHVIEQQEQIDAKNKEIEILKAQQEKLNKRLERLEELLK